MTRKDKSGGGAAKQGSVSRPVDEAATPDAASDRKDRKLRTVPIGVPMSEEEFRRLKREAEKPDDSRDRQVPAGCADRDEGRHDE